MLHGKQTTDPRILHNMSATLKHSLMFAITVYSRKKLPACRTGAYRCKNAIAGEQTPFPLFRSSVLTLVKCDA